MGKAYGYIRQTPKDQNDVTQLTMLMDAGVNEAFLFEDKISNTSSDCPAFRRLIKKLNPGDILFVTSLDQLGKNCDEVKEHWKAITKDCNCDLVVLDTPVLDTRLGENVKDIVIKSFNAFSRIKRNYAHQRQAEGIAIARVNEVTLGRRSMPIPDNYTAIAGMYGNNQISAREAARRLNVATSTFLKWYRGGNTSTQKASVEQR